MKVYLIIKRVTVDYEGSSNETIDCFSNLDSANKEINRLESLNNDYNTDYFIECFNVKD